MGAQKAQRARIIIASIIGCVLTLQMGAFSVVLETTLSGITELPFGAFCALMQPIHLAIGLVEGLITAAVLCFIYETRPEMLKGIGKNDVSGSSRMERGTVITVIGVAAAVVGGVVSLFASGLPDGLEWSVERVAGEVEGAGGGAYTIAERIQNFFAFLPDYSFPGSESAAGTSVSGIVGSAMVLILVVAVSWLIRSFMKQKQS
jgi:cobalt/nickel transport system permease protein